MQFCNQCGGPIDGDPAQCPNCGAARHASAVTATTGEAEETSFFAPPSFGGPGETSSTPLAPDSRYDQPTTPDYGVPTNGSTPGGGFDPYTGQPLTAPAPPSAYVSEDTVADAAPAYAPPPSYEAPSPAPQPAYVPPAAQQPPESGFQAAIDEGQNARPEIKEIIVRVLGERYKFVREIGAGGMSIVYLMEDTILQTPVAVKVLYPELAINPEVANRFKNEAVITAKLTGNPHIIKVYDYGYKERIHYIITMYLSGHSLRDEMKNRFTRNEKFDWREAAEVMIAVGKALESVHAKNVVHRDIKPGNIIFENGSPVLIDFGIAKIPQEQQGREWLVTTQAGMSLGTPHYISPEEAQGLGSTPKSDIYSLGVVFYEMVAGRVPFDGESAQQIMIDHVTKEPEDPTIYNSNLPSHIAQIVLKLLRKDPNQRLSATELVQNLEAQLGISSRGSSAASEAIGSGGSRGAASSSAAVEGATIMTKKVMKGKKLPAKSGAASGGEGITPLSVILMLGILGGGGYYLYPMLFPPKAVVAPPTEVRVETTDPLENQMSALYDEAVVDVGERNYKTALAKFKKVYAWNSSWRSVEPAYQATKDFIEGKDKYLSGRARTSFEQAATYFDKAEKGWSSAFNNKPFPFADEYKIASQHMFNAIAAEEAAAKASGDAKTKALWEAQLAYEQVANKIPWEASAYIGRLDALLKYRNAMIASKNAAGEEKAVAQIQATIDEALTGLEDDKEHLLLIYEVWAVPIYGQALKDTKKAEEYAATAKQIRAEWEAAGKPGPDSEDTAEAEAVDALKSPAPAAVPDPAANSPAPAEGGTTPVTK